MRLKKYGPFSFILFLILTISFFLFGCDKYQSESYELSTLDASACAQIQDTLYNTVTGVRLTDFNPAWTHENVQPNVPSIIDSLKANGIVVSEGDLADWVDTVGDEDTNYVCFTTNLSSEVFYSDQVVGLKLMDTQGEFHDASSISMPLETVGGCLNEKGNPLIRTRIQYSSPDDDYLLYVINQETTLDSIIVLSILKSN